MQAKNQTPFSFGRALDPSYPTNLIILLLTLAVTMGVLLLRLTAGVDFGGSVWDAVRVAISVFLVWAVAREIDPDYEWSAFVGLLPALLAILALGLPDILLIFVLMSLLRVVNRTTGLTPKGLEMAALMLPGGLVAFLSGWLYGLIVTAAFALDFLLSPAAQRRIAFTVGALILTLAALLINGNVVQTLSADYRTVMLLIGVLFVPVIITSRHIRSGCDAAGSPLNPLRIQAAQSLTLVGSLIAALVYGDAGMLAMLPIWAALLGVGLYRLPVLLMRARQKP